MEGRHAERVGQRESGFGLERAQPLTPSFPLVAPVARSRSCGHGRRCEFRSSTFDADERDFGNDDASRLQFGQRCMKSVDMPPTLQEVPVHSPATYRGSFFRFIVTRPNLFSFLVMPTTKANIRQLFIKLTASSLAERYTDAHKPSLQNTRPARLRINLKRRNMKAVDNATRG